MGAALLCVCNYPANTGYAWDFIESLYAGMATRLAGHGIRTLVAYPEIALPPRTLDGSPARAVKLDVTLRSRESIRATCDLVQREGVAVVYLTDRPAHSLAYARLRRAGVRRIVVHDHSSGERSVPSGPRRALKWLLARAPYIVADEIIAVSDFVARRHIETGMMPVESVTRVWNGVEVPVVPADASRALHAAFGLADARPVILCACRAASEKGVLVLLRAFDLVAARWPAGKPRPALVDLGDGPQFAEIQHLHAQLPSNKDIFVPGYRPDARSLQAGADVCAMPSLWQDALPLAVSQPMALGRPVVGSRVGGIPEMIVDGETGILVPPGDEATLAAAIERLLADPAYAHTLGRAARARMASLFRPDDQLDALTKVVLRGFPGR